MGRLTGRSIILYDKVKAGVDDFNRPIYTETPVTVENVLIGTPTTQEIIDKLTLTDKRAVYTLGIPKGDTHVWNDRRVELPSDFPAGKYRTIGYPTIGQSELIPLKWGKNVMVEKYE